MPNFSLIDENLEITQEVPTFPMCGLWQNSILTNAPTVRAVKTDKTRRRSESAYICQVRDNVMMYTSTHLHTCLPSNVRRHR